MKSYLNDFVEQTQTTRTPSANYGIATQPALNTPIGWVCPKCGRVYSPTTFMCYYCDNNATTTTIDPTTVDPTTKSIPCGGGGVDCHNFNYCTSTNSKTTGTEGMELIKKDGTTITGTPNELFVTYWKEGYNEAFDKFMLFMQQEKENFFQRLEKTCRPFDMTYIIDLGTSGFTVQRDIKSRKRVISIKYIEENDYE